MAAVDIIIPLYNKEDTVARAVQSVIDQTFTDWHLIIVDDGSTDNSLQVARQYDDPRIRIIEQDNRGPGAARNRGIEEATAEYLAFLDADDQWYPFYLDNALKAMKQSDAAFVGSMYDEWPAQTDMTAYWAKRNVHPGNYKLTGGEHPKEVLAKLFFFHVGNSVVHTEIARQYGGFYDEGKCLLGEDTVFFAKLIFNERFTIIGPTAVRHNRQNSDLSNLKNRPLDIFLKRPEVVLDHCRGEKKNRAQKVLSWHALRVAHFRARNGYKDEAVYLREKFPMMRRYRFLYYKLGIEIRFSRWLPYWIRLKCRIAVVLKKIAKQSEV
ncbi:MAG: glycosyltransferase family 2 protein [Planctomycetota bacterium]